MCTHVFTYLPAICIFMYVLLPVFINEVIQLEQVLPHALRSAVSLKCSCSCSCSCGIIIIISIVIVVVTVDDISRNAAPFCICAVHFALHSLFVPFARAYCSTLLICINTANSREDESGTQREREKEKRACVCIAAPMLLLSTGKQLLQLNSI